MKTIIPLAYLLIVIALMGCKDEKKKDIEADASGWYNGGGGVFGGRGQAIDKSGLVQAVPLLVTPTPTLVALPPPTQPPYHNVPDGGNSFMMVGLILIAFIYLNREKL